MQKRVERAKMRVAGQLEVVVRRRSGGRGREGEGGGGNQYSAGWLTGLTPSCLGGGSGPRSQEVGEEGDYIYPYRYTATTRITPALRWVAMRTILVFH